MSVGTAFACVLGCAAAAWILVPLLRPEADRAAGVRRRDSERAELLSRKEMLLAALRDLEDDRDTGKIADEDYAPLKSRLEAEAVEVLQKLDALNAAGTAAPVLPRPTVVERRDPS